MQALLLEGNPLELDIMYRILVGFGARTVSHFRLSSEACDHLKKGVPDLVVVGMPVAGGDGLDATGFAKWVRRCESEQMRMVFIILVAGHTSQENVLLARDSGANFVVQGPSSPKCSMTACCGSPGIRRPS